MAFKPPRNTPQFADLKGILAQSNKQDKALYQTVQKLIERLELLKDITGDQIAAVGAPIDISKLAPKTATYHTKEDETGALPNSVQLLAGIGIIFDDSVANKRTIKIDEGLKHYDSPLSDGDLLAADLIFASGECIIVQVPI